MIARTIVTIVTDWIMVFDFGLSSEFAVGLQRSFVPINGKGVHGLRELPVAIVPLPVLAAMLFSERTSIS